MASTPSQELATLLSCHDVSVILLSFSLSAGDLQQPVPAVERVLPRGRLPPGQEAGLPRQGPGRAGHGQRRRGRLQDQRPPGHQRSQAARYSTIHKK